MLVWSSTYPGRSSVWPVVQSFTTWSRKLCCPAQRKCYLTDSDFVIHWSILVIEVRVTWNCWCHSDVPFQGCKNSLARVHSKLDRFTITKTELLKCMYTLVQQTLQGDINKFGKYTWTKYWNHLLHKSHLSTGYQQVSDRLVVYLLVQHYSAVPPWKWLKLQHWAPFMAVPQLIKIMMIKLVIVQKLAIWGQIAKVHFILYRILFHNSLLSNYRNTYKTKYRQKHLAAIWLPSHGNVAKGKISTILKFSCNPTKNAQIP